MEEQVKGVLVVFLMFAGFILLAVVIGSTYQITESRAKPKIETLLGTGDFKIIDQSNNSLLVGSPGDVIYNIRLSDGSVVSCRCTDGVFQPLICRKYQ